jgi:putative transposase
MPRAPRINTAGTIFHVLNRANSKLKIFEQNIDYEEFIEVLTISLKKYEIDIYSYKIMPTHWHIVCSARIDGEISRWMSWLQASHTQRWHSRHKTIGRGHFYQGRFKSFIIQKDQHFLQVCRYVERNALRAGLVKRAEDWRWSSLNRRNKIPISKWPIEKPKKYLEFVNESMTNKELDSIRNSLRRGSPYGKKEWVEKIVVINKLESTIKTIGRPKKKGA